jgi:hypothetical protein
MADTLSSRCPTCNQVILPGDTRITARGADYHSRCFENNTNPPWRHRSDPGRSKPLK